ncbi:MarR family winged helix-turn-helix transcriptional regulator [Nocardia terpenica]|uniref:MarR family transcriptional regulator n=1 Tax=Nocardia terpenica TaxID=455432 RepID=A0A6G9YUS3_9NOCA|nr:MarR family transcriptional regulator [Nocardia terpenica]QIS16952.1 MarR family transcriptional regulator [Nocardia terpenica]
MAAEPHPTAAVPYTDGLNYLLFRAHYAVYRHLEDELTELGVTITQLGLAAAVQHYGPLSVADLARIHGITPQSVTTATNHLHHLGWISRRPHPTHKRVVLLELTDTGRHATQTGRRIVDRINSTLTNALGGHATQFVDNLATIMTAVGVDPPAVTTLRPNPS